MMHYTKVLNCFLYEHVSSIKKYCWNTWHLKHFIAAIIRFCLNNSISIFLQISFKNKSTIVFECVSHLPSANCIHNFMAADFLIFEPSFYFDGHTVWLKFVLLVFICKIDFEKFITITLPKKDIIKVQTGNHIRNFTWSKSFVKYEHIQHTSQLPQRRSNVWLPAIIVPQSNA